MMDGVERGVFEVIDGGLPSGGRTRTRDSLFLIARMWVDGIAGEQEVRVRNLSAGGLMAESARSLDIGTGVRLDLRGIGEVRGKVAWYAEGRAGIALDAPIDPKRARKPVGGRSGVKPGR